MKGESYYQPVSLMWWNYFVGEDREMEVVSLGLSTAFDTVSNNIVIDKLIKYGLGKRTIWWELAEQLGLEAYDQWHKVECQTLLVYPRVDTGSSPV